MTGLAASDIFHARLLRDHLVVVDRARGEMRVLNPTAAILWLLLDEAVHDATSLALACTELLEDVPADLAVTIQATLEEWSGLGWLEETDGGYRITHNLTTELDGLRGRGVLHPADTALPDHTLTAELYLRLGGKSFRVALGDTGAAGFPDTLARLRAVLSGMVVEADAEEALQLRWIHDGDAFWLASVDAVLWTADESFALSSVVTALFQNAYAAGDLFATMHAAAVCRKGAVVLLPGVSGSGKSTLTAYLAARGWGYLGDDVIALGRAARGEPFEVHPFPTAIGIKPGSWPILRPYYPNIDALPIVPYADRHARFLPLPDCITGDGPRQCLHAIVLPRYTPGTAISIEPIGPVEALCDLIQAGVTTGEAIHPLRVEILLDMLEEVPVYRLRHGDLGEAARVLEGLVACS